MFATKYQDCSTNRRGSVIVIPVMDRNPKDFCEGVADCARRLVEDRLSALAAQFDLTAERLVRYGVAITRYQHDA